MISSPILLTQTEVKWRVTRNADWGLTAQADQVKHMHTRTCTQACYLCIQYATWQESGQMMQMQWNWRFASAISPHHSNGTRYFLLPVLLSRWQQAAWVKILAEAAKSIRLTLHMPAPLLQVNLLEPTRVKSQMKKWKNVVWGKTGRTWQRESKKVKVKILKTKWALLSLSHISHMFSHSASERQKNRLLHFTCGNQPTTTQPPPIPSSLTHTNLQCHITQIMVLD